MNQWQRDVEKFHVWVAQSERRPAEDPGFQDERLRVALVVEETNELVEAVEEKKFAEAVDALVDILYVTIGTAVAWGINLAPIWEAVHGANMAKKDGPLREDGKRLKPPGWTKPDVAALIQRQIDAYRRSEP